MIDGSVLQSTQRCFEKKSRVVVKMVVMANAMLSFLKTIFKNSLSFVSSFSCWLNLVPRVRVTLDQRSGKRDSGINRFGSHFHWLKSEHEQLDRK